MAPSDSASLFGRFQHSAAPACRATMAASSVGPAPRTAAAFWAMTLLQTRATMATAASGMNGAARATAAGACWFSVAPASTGTSTTCEQETHNFMYAQE